MSNNADVTLLLSTTTLIFKYRLFSIIKSIKIFIK